ncbi:MAG: hypothetical protein AMXMBFR58_11260 [Phycisphaerae bacterium]
MRGLLPALAAGGTAITARAEIFSRRVAPGSLEPCREIRYTQRNPLERDSVKRPEDWRWSSVLWWMGHREQEAECASAR